MLKSSLYQKKIEKKFHEWKICFICYPESINIEVKQNYTKNIYESSFKLENLQSLKFFFSKNTIKEILDLIITLISHNEIQIEENSKILKLILISTIENIPNEELILIKNEKISEKNEKENQMELEIKNQITNCNLTIINIFKPHIKTINAMLTFPSGNIISVSDDKSIIIYDSHLKIINKIENAHTDWIISVDIKDDNNFVTCSIDKSIKTWIKKKINNESKFYLNQTINNAHEEGICKVIYSINENIISCSIDSYIKIWELDNKNNKYQNIITIINNRFICSLLLIKDKNILISIGGEGTKFWNIYNYNLITYIKEAVCGSYNALQRIDNDRIIIGSDEDKLLKIISLSEKKIIKTIFNECLCYGICVIENKGIFITGGYYGIQIFRNDNYECIQTIKDDNTIKTYGLIEIKNGMVVSFSNNQIICLCSFDL